MKRKQGVAATCTEALTRGRALPFDGFILRLPPTPPSPPPLAGSNFGKYHTVGTVLAGFHYDLNLLTIHGKSRFPALDVWLRDGR